MQTMVQIGPSKNPKNPRLYNPFLSLSLSSPSVTLPQPHNSLSLSLPLTLSLSHARIERRGMAPVTVRRIQRRSRA